MRKIQGTTAGRFRFDLRPILWLDDSSCFLAPWADCMEKSNMKATIQILTLALVVLMGGVRGGNADEAKQSAQVQAARRAELYQVAAAKTYNIHAHDHARILGKYAAVSDAPLPVDVVREHAVAIRTNVARAQQAYNKLAKSAAGNPKVLEQLAEVQKRLAAVTKQVAQLEASQATEAQTVRAATSTIATDLKATHEVSKEIDAALNLAQQNQDADENFDNPRSADYYFTGEGHFLD
jgi:cytochrome c556